MNVLLVEDDVMHADYLREMVRTAIPEATSIYVAKDGHIGEQMAREHEVLSIVMDLRMKGRNGIEAARTIWGERPSTRILFWSNYSDEAYLRGIDQIVPEEAAYGYVLKTATASRMRLSLRAVLVEAQIIVDPEIHQLQHRQIRSDTALSDVELNILLDLALGLPDKTIALRRNIALRTVQNRLLSIYEKLDASSVREGTLELMVNKRVRAVAQAITRQIINRESLEMAERALQEWLKHR